LVCEKCVPIVKKNIDRAIKSIHQWEIKYDSSNNPDEKINLGLQIIKTLKFLVTEYSSKGIPTFSPEPQQMLSDYDKKLADLSLLTTARENYAKYGDPRDFLPKLKDKRLFSDMKWCSAPGDKTCNICLNREGKTVEEIENMKDGLPARAPCHDGCRCVWIAKLKSFQDLLPDYLKPAGKGIFEESIADWEMKRHKPGIGPKNKN
jgi:hypothetical protein